MKVLVINGPNMNMLGKREKDVYGTESYEDFLAFIRNCAKELDIEITFFQSNHEGEIIDRIQASLCDGTEALVINAAAFTHYSYAIRDALAILPFTKAEVHMSDIEKREEFRRNDVIFDVCDARFMGRGFESYREALSFVKGR